jgi:hypothetical protein
MIKLTASIISFATFYDSDVFKINPAKRGQNIKFDRQPDYLCYWPVSEPCNHGSSVQQRLADYM